MNYYKQSNFNVRNIFQRKGMINSSPVAALREKSPEMIMMKVCISAGLLHVIDQLNKLFCSIEYRSTVMFILRPLY